MSSKNVANEIWDEIKDKDVDMFTLPNQKVNMYCKPMPIDSGRLFLTFNTSSFLPALEQAIGPKYKVELVTKYIVVSRVENIG